MLLSSLFPGCFGAGASTASTSAPLLDDAPPPSCVFCHVDPQRFNIVLEDDRYICFKDRSPAAQHHLLVIPRQHIASVKTLTCQHVDMVKEMQFLGQRALELLSPDAKAERRFGFHIPPFTSVDHLHLHALQLPFRSSLRSLKYRIAPAPSNQYHKGWSWFVEFSQACAILQDGDRIKIAKC
ncbi:hypothetical protein ACQY0O_000961 [Thecaphora frezii]